MEGWDLVAYTSLFLIILSNGVGSAPWPKQVKEMGNSNMNEVYEKPIQSKENNLPPDHSNSIQDNTGDNKVINGKTKVTVFSYNNFDGASEMFDISEECQTLPAEWHKRISSINTHNSCVVVCQYKNCGGRCLTVAPGTPGHSRLRQVNFDKRIISMKSCA